MNLEHKTSLVAHGGFSSEYPENTLESYVASLPFEPDGIEMDIVFFEGELYCFHPETPNYSDEDIWLELSQKNNLNEVNFTLISKQLLGFAGFLLLDLKQKDTNLLPVLLAAIEDFQNMSNQAIWVGARTRTHMEIFEEYRETIKILAMPKNIRNVSEFLENSPDGIRLWSDEVSNTNILDFHNQGIKVFVTPGKPATLTSARTSGNIDQVMLLDLIASGVDAVLVNDIEMARNVYPVKS